MNLSVWLGVGLLLVLPLSVIALVIGAYYYVRCNYLDFVLRIFQEKPLFIIPRGESRPGAEDVAFPTTDGLTLRGCYLRTEQPRKGVILFGLEFGSSRWSCQAYCESLLAAGYDIFAFEPRNQGESDCLEGYLPLQWLTRFEVEDTHAAIAYLKSRDDADPKGIGFFGISKGANAGLVAASQEPWIRCVVTDGAFGILTTMVPYMRKWVSLYNNYYLVHGLLPAQFYGAIAKAGIRQVERERNVEFVDTEGAMRRLKRPLLMIHGGADTYIKVSMAQELFRRASGAKSFWTVERAKHNQALHVAGAEYARRVTRFFDLHLAGLEPGVETPIHSTEHPSEAEGASLAEA